MITCKTQQISSNFDWLDHPISSGILTGIIATFIIIILNHLIAYLKYKKYNGSYTEVQIVTCIEQNVWSNVIIHTQFLPLIMKVSFCDKEHGKAIMNIPLSATNRTSQLRGMYDHDKDNGNFWGYYDIDLPDSPDVIKGIKHHVKENDPNLQELNYKRIIWKKNISNQI